MQHAKIIALCILAACAYGVLHDQVTTRVCVEYFTIGHAPVFATDSPTLLALGWGILATWWVGAILGVALALCARLGRVSKLPASAFFRPIGMLLAVMALTALLAGLAGYSAARHGIIWLAGPIASRVPADRHHLFIADLWAHNASYAAGFIGGTVLCVQTIMRRRRHRSVRPAASSPLPRQ